MKRFLMLSLIWIQCGFLHSLQAQENQDNTDDLQDNRGNWQTEKKHVVEQFMDLSTDEAKKFWPLYAQYAAKLERLVYYRMALMQQYENNFPNMSESQAIGYTNRLFKNDGALTRLQKKYFGRMRHVLTPMRASQFIQIEYEMQAMIRAEMQRRAPFIGDIKKGL
ncbi:MAG: hypothetical protein ACJ75B_17070 [Flavisolibacter sp.]